MKKLFENIWMHKTNRTIALFSVVTLLFFLALILVPPTTSRGVFLRFVFVLIVWPAALFFTFLLSSRIGSQGYMRKHKSALAGNYTLDLMRHLSFPVVICGEDGRIVWFNPVVEAMWDAPQTLLAMPISELCGVTADVLAASEEEGGYPVRILDKPYAIHAYRFASRSKTYTLTIWESREELESAEKRFADKNPLVAYIMVDNLDELLQYVEEQFGSASSRIEEELLKWAEAAGGILRSYDRNRYLMLFPGEALNSFTENRFEILDRIREIRIGDGSMPVTVSIGISGRTGTLVEKDRDARASLDMALQRGGDQVVLKTETGLEFFGGRNKGVQRRTKVRARVVANEIAALISKSRNVIIMSHRNADFDAFGSSMGLARLCLFCGVDVNVVSDMQDPNLKKCHEKILALPEYRNVFVSATQAQELINSDTLLLITDVCNPAQFESQELYRASFSTVIIDHHRKTVEFETKPALSYIEPSASSACELVSEILEQSMPAGSIPKEEADLMFAGILLDTKQFSRNTGVRTFSAALFLRNEGANPVEAQALFKTDLHDYMREARFATNVYMYCGVIAIAVNNADDNTSTDRIAAAKAADKLLTVEGVQASFALCRIGNTIHISARSSGNINVQLILEKLNGGGHFDAAGAQLADADMTQALSQLKEAIDSYLKEI